MAYDKKMWVNVDDPSKFSSDQLNSFPRYDAENMNRIEDGIYDAHTLLDTKAPAGHGLGTETERAESNASFLETIKKGCGFYEMGTDVDTPIGYNEWMSMLQIIRSLNDGTEAGAQLAFYDFSTSKPRMWLRTVLKGKPTEWAEILHTANASTLVLDAIGNLPIAKGGTGATKDSEAADNLKVKSIGGGTEVTKNADLNSYITIGNYICSMSSVAQTLTNCPISKAFVMTVGYAHGGSEYISQEITQFDTGVKYYRFYDAISKVWSDWIVTYSTSNKPTPTDIGAAQIVTGDYVGNGESKSEAVLIPCDKQPKLIVITGGKNDNKEYTSLRDKGMLAIAVLKKSGDYYCFGCYDESPSHSDCGAEIDYITINYDDGFLKLDTRNSGLGDSINHSTVVYYYALLY